MVLGVVSPRNLERTHNNLKNMAIAMYNDLVAKQTNPTLLKELEDVTGLRKGIDGTAEPELPANSPLQYSKIPP